MVGIKSEHRTVIIVLLTFDHQSTSQFINYLIVTYFHIVFKLGVYANVRRQFADDLFLITSVFSKNLSFSDLRVKKITLSFEFLAIHGAVWKTKHFSWDHHWYGSKFFYSATSDPHTN